MMNGTTENRRLGDLAGAFLKLGLISFGGPVAHIGYLRTEFVEKRRWLNDAAFADLVALCQFLPGPASSQAVFALGVGRAGWAGGLLASLCFTLPSAVLMILFALGVASLGDLAGAGWLHGLKLAAVAVVAQAVWSMGRNLCPDRARLTIAVGGASFVLCVPGAASQLGVMLAAAGVGWILFHNTGDLPDRRLEQTGATPKTGMAPGLLGLFALLLLVPPVATAFFEAKELALFERFYRAGSLVFGGGHVILPLLQAEVVSPGWVSEDAFLAGYGAAQALPGPLFTFAGFLGAQIYAGPQALAGGLLCLGAIFLPGLLLISGVLPYWNMLREKAWVLAALRGANAGVVGILLAALYQPVWLAGISGPADFALALAAFGALLWWKCPPWIVVVLCAAAGQLVK